MHVWPRSWKAWLEVDSLCPLCVGCAHRPWHQKAAEMLSSCDAPPPSPARVTEEAGVPFSLCRKRKCPNLALVTGSPTPGWTLALSLPGGCPWQPPRPTQVCRALSMAVFPSFVNLPAVWASGFPDTLETSAGKRQGAPARVAATCSCLLGCGGCVWAQLGSAWTPGFTAWAPRALLGLGA